MRNKIFGYHQSEYKLDVILDGKTLYPDKSQAFLNHSPDGFAAGYTGSGPAQLALAILMEFTDQITALTLHHDFKNEFLADPRYQENDFVIEVDIHKWIVENSR